MKRRISAGVAKAIGFVTAGVAVVAGLKTGAEIVAGKSVEIQQVAFYLGSAAVALYAGFVAATLILTVATFVLAAVMPESFFDRVLATRALDICVVALCGAVVVGCFVDGRIFDYHAASEQIRALVAVVGVAAVAVGIWTYRMPDPVVDGEPAAGGGSEPGDVSAAAAATDT